MVPHSNLQLTLKLLIERLPYIRRLHRQIAQLKSELGRWRTWKPPGHFYSPIPCLDEVRKDELRIFNNIDAAIPAIDLNCARQSQLLECFRAFYAQIPFPDVRADGFRYYFENEYFSYADGVTLYSMLRHVRPQRVIEIGSGFSSALMLDTNDRFLDRSVQFIFIEPHPERLESLLRETDSADTTILRQRVQETSLYLFQELQPGDILFVDSSHVSKTGSDVNYVLFEVLPILASGVNIHFHDIFFPFEYPRSWVYEGLAFNEAYLIRAFLEYNPVFEIEFFVSFVMQRLRDEVAAAMPLALKSEKEKVSLAHDAPGSSIWLKKTRPDL